MNDTPISQTAAELYTQLQRLCNLLTIDGMPDAQQAMQSILENAAAIRDHFNASSR